MGGLSPISSHAGLCFRRCGSYNRRQTENWLQTMLKRSLATMLLLVLLGVGLVACGQKGGLVRPEPTTVTVVSN